MSSITIQIGLGFVIGCAMTLLFVVAYIRNAIRDDRVSKMGSALEAMAVRVAARFSVELLKVPEVNDAFTKLIAGGINAWLKDPNAQKHIEDLLASSSQEAKARELGAKIPGLAGSFTKGMLDGLRGRSPPKDPSTKQITDKTSSSQSLTETTSS